MPHLIDSIQAIGGGGRFFIRDIERTIKIVFVCSIPNITKRDIKEYTIKLILQRSNRDIDRNIIKYLIQILRKLLILNKNSLGYI